MSEQSAVAQQLPSEIPSLLIPTHRRPLLVPNASVVEIVPLMQPIKNPDTPPWHMGTYLWRDQRLPVVSFEALNEGGNPIVTRTSRVAVINAISGQLKNPYFALVIQGIPRLVRVFEDEISKEDEQCGPAEAMHVLVAGERAVMPDLDYIEQKLVPWAKGR